ncbi:MAG: prepilin-type N-terminal cleavage/methylation domain-containing protein [Saccharofermentans sp.]|nr:prepilin-type N-terminal cleavage/methylation domain-containing protein [Saccharofermentans sp.]
MKSKKGFTLIEIMIVVAIIVVISAVGVIAIGDTLKNTRDKKIEYQQHIDSMGYAQGNVKNIMADTRSPNVPKGSAQPPTPQGDNGDKTAANPTPAETKTEDKEEPKTETETETPGTVEIEKKEEEQKQEEEKQEETPVVTPGDTVTPGSVSPAAGTTTSTVNYWNKRDGYSDGFFKITTEKSVSEMTIVVPSGVKVKNLDWRYKQETNEDGTVTITYTADPSHGKIKTFDLQFEANMKEIPAGTFVVVSYK